MEILKEAYWKVGRQKEALTVTRKLADSYFSLGQYASALLEYEGILKREPGSPTWWRCSPRWNRNFRRPPRMILQWAARTPRSPSISVRWFRIDPTLITTKQTIKPDASTVHLKLDSDGNEPLAKFLIQHKLAADDVAAKLPRTRAQDQQIERRPGARRLAARRHLPPAPCRSNRCSAAFSTARICLHPARILRRGSLDREDAAGGAHARPPDRPLRYHEPHGDDRHGQSLRRERQGSRAAAARLQHPVAPRLAAGDLQSARRDLPPRRATCASLQP